MGWKQELREVNNKFSLEEQSKLFKEVYSDWILTPDSSGISLTQEILDKAFEQSYRDSVIYGTGFIKMEWDENPYLPKEYIDNLIEDSPIKDIWEKTIYTSSPKMQDFDWAWDEDEEDELQNLGLSSSEIEELEKHIKKTLTENSHEDSKYDKYDLKKIKEKQKHCWHKWELVGKSPVLNEDWYNCSLCGISREEDDKDKKK